MQEGKTKNSSAGGSALAVLPSVWPEVYCEDEKASIGSDET
jgi:hypothetical protein